MHFYEQSYLDVQIKKMMLDLEECSEQECTAQLAGISLPTSVVSRYP